MKSLKKILSIFAAFMMVVGLTMTNASATENGEIILKDGRNGVTYTPYQIFGLTVGEENSSYAYTINKNSPFYNWLLYNKYLSTSEKEDATQVDLVETGKANTPMWFTVTEKNADTFSNAIYNAIEDGSLLLTGNTVVKGDDFTATTTTTTHTWNLGLGYYIIVPSVSSGALKPNVTQGAICNITTNAPTVTVAPKSAKPEVKKEAYEGNKPTDGSVSVGDTLRFVLTGSMPITTGYTTYTYKLTDTMRHLTLDTTKEIVVKFGDTEMSSLPAGALTTQEKGIVLSFNAVNYQEYVGQPITVTYYATVDADAVTTDEEGKPVVIDNKVELNYGPQGDQDGNGETETFTTAKLPVLKTDDATGMANPLAGAQFILKKSDTEYYVRNVDGTNGWGSEEDATPLTSDKNGNLVFEGIEKGSYTLIETVAPEGYSKLTKPIQITIDRDDEGKYTVEVANKTELTGIVDVDNNTVTVVNSTGHALPSTGGMGTTMIYIAGAILMVGAAVIFVTNKRMKHE
ncbi:SpaA isopeptide-forming pilin-related protein [uncultured Dubosiella sp.]|uniref:SpaA isopeptide-forming pilin-related protein n=2 Tax=uncultured Dubosiella sp. TaxID=1937011 RepID=UPI002608C433|nr:SpaA isopeptide-forming pilin-related protein [uncultured Dubosiella sp.]